MTKRTVLSFDKDDRLQVTEKEVKIKPEVRPVVSLFAEATSLGLSISLPMAIGGVVGLWLDKRFHTTPNLTILLLIVGIIVGIYNFYRYIKMLSKATKKR